MSDEVQVSAEAGLTSYFHVRTKTHKVWYPAGSTFETYGNGARDSDDYDVALSDMQAGFYVGNFPSAISDVDEYAIIVFKQLGANPDDADLVIGSEMVAWDGSDITNALSEHLAHAFFTHKASQSKDSGDITLYDGAGTGVIGTFAYSDTDSALVRTVS